MKKETTDLKEDKEGYMGSLEVGGNYVSITSKNDLKTHHLGAGETALCL